MHPNNQNFLRDVFVGGKLSPWPLRICKQVEQSKTNKTVFWALLEQQLGIFPWCMWINTEVTEVIWFAIVNAELSTVCMALTMGVLMARNNI